MKGGRRKAEGGRRREGSRRYTAACPPSPFPLPPSLPSSTAHCPLPTTHYLRRGVSLMEVLISTFVIAIGLLGLAALIPVGRFTLVEAGMADRSGACGRAALRDVKVRGMLDYDTWSLTPADTDIRPFVIDPLGVNAVLGDLVPPNPPTDLMSAVLRRTFNGWTPNMANQVFVWHDDLVFDIPEDRTLRPTAPPGYGEEGNYSWFLTVTPAANESALPYSEKRLYTISVVVCYKRDLGLDAVTGNPTGECTPDVLQFVGSGYGGGTVQLDAVVEVREGEWIALVGIDLSGVVRQCKWYRVVSAGELLINTTTGDPDTSGSPATRLNLDGPDWDTVSYPAANTTAVIIDGVIGVYTTTIEID